MTSRIPIRRMCVWPAAWALIAIFSLLHWSVCGQTFYSDKDLRFRHFQIKDGLPSNTVRSILEDQKGFLWFGTQTGVVRFDGYKFQSLSADTGVFELDRASVDVLFEDRTGLIWIGTARHGLFIYDPRRMKSDPVLLDSTNAMQVTSIFDVDQDTSGNIWVASSAGLYRIPQVLNNSTDEADLVSQQATQIGLAVCREVVKNGY